MKAENYVRLFGAVMIYCAVTANGSSAEPVLGVADRDARGKQQDDAETEAIEEIRQAGGLIERYGDSLLFAFKNPHKSTDASLARVMPALKRLKNLKRVKLLDTQLSDAAISTLKELQELEYLSVTRTKLTDAAVKDLATLSNLTTLWMGATRITDAGLAPLKQLTKLEFLYLGNTKVTDAGIDDLLAIKNLKYVYLGDTAVSPAGFEKLKKARPELIVVML